MRSRRSPLASQSHHLPATLRRLSARGWRRVLCLVIICAMLILPDAGYAVSAASSLAVQIAKDTVAPVPVAIEWFTRLFGHAAMLPQQETTVDRNARVQHIRISPGRFVGYIGDTINYVAMGVDANGQQREQGAA
jgi:hypothetical protein